MAVYLFAIRRVNYFQVSKFTRDRSASVAILAALMFAVFIGCLALAVDTGALYVERRQAQGAVDLAAMAAAADLDHAEAAAEATLAANGLGNVGTVVVELGNYQPDPTVNYRNRFTSGATPYNAARVSLNKPGTVYFAKVFTSRVFDIGVTAVSSNGALASFSVGSRLLAVRGGLINSLLGTLLGSNVTLSVMDYNALLSGNVNLLPFMNALATRLNITAGTYNDVLNSSASMGDVLAAMASVTQQNGQSSANIALNNLLQQTGHSTLMVPLSSIINLGPIGSLHVGDPVPGFDAVLKAMDVISAAAVLADGKHQVSVDLAVNIPGVLGVTLDIAIGEPMQYSGWVAVGQSGSTVTTAQTRLRLTAQVGGTGVLAGTTIRLPLYLDLAAAKAQLTGIACAPDGTGTVTIGATPGLADVWIGDTTADMTNFSSNLTVTPAVLVSLPIASVTGSSHVGVGNLSATPLAFTQDDINNAVIKTTDTRNIIQSLVSTTLGQLTVKVNVLGLGIGVPSGLTSAVASTLGAVAAPLDDVIYTVLTTLGVHVGEADVKVEGVRCSGSGQLAG